MLLPPIALRIDAVAREYCMKGLFLDASDALADVFDRMVRPDDPAIVVNQDDVVPAEALPSLLDGYDFVLDDHSYLPTDALRNCKSLKHVIFLGTGRAVLHAPGGAGRARHHGAHHQGLRRRGGGGAHGGADLGGGARIGGDGPRHARRPMAAHRRACSFAARRSDCWVSAASRGRSRPSWRAPGCGWSRGTARRARRPVWSSWIWTKCWRRATCCRCTCC